MSVRYLLMIAACMPTFACDAAQKQMERSDRHPPMRAPVELNLTGFENLPKPIDRENYEYILPTDQTLDYFASHGFRTFRLLLSWERMQPQAGGPFAEDKVKALDAFLDRAGKRHLAVIADLSAFARRDGKLLGTPALPTTALVDFWERFSTRFDGRFVGYDIMNEPHDMPSPQTWPDAAQRVVDAIRRHDRTTTLYIEGDDWSNAARWPQSNANLDVHDPAHRMLYSAHIYFDRDTSGQYRVPYEKDGATPDIGRERLQPFVDWLRAHKVKGHIGEFGAPYADPRWTKVVDNFLDEVVDDRDVITGAAYFAAGDWMDFYDLTLQPAKNSGWADRPQMSTLTKMR